MNESPTSRWKDVALGVVVGGITLFIILLIFRIAIITWLLSSFTGKGYYVFRAEDPPINPLVLYIIIVAILNYLAIKSDK